MSKEHRVFIILSCFFVANVILAEFIGVKIFSLEATLGLAPLNWSILHHSIHLDYTCGVIIWPVVFVLTDIINDYYGMEKVKFLTYIAIAVTIYAFFVSKLSIAVEPTPWWTVVNANKGIPDSNLAFKAIFGQGNNIIVGSLIAFLIGQILDASIFQLIKKKSKTGGLWVRATVSTLFSQLIDSFVVLYVAFYLGQDWPLGQVLHIALNNYLYKGIVAIAMIPVLHLVHQWLTRYFGTELSHAMRTSSLKNQDRY